MRGIRVGGGSEDDPGSPSNAAVGGFCEAQLLSGGLETGPGDVDVVLALVERVGSDGQPLLVAAIVDRRDHGVFPVYSVGGAIYGNRAVAIQVLTELCEEKIPVAIHVDTGVAERNWNSTHAGKESGRKGLPAVG